MSSRITATGSGSRAGRVPLGINSTSPIDRMVSQGLVKKEKSLDKKNLVRVRLTDKGERLYHEAIGMKPMRRFASME
jgi:hypothetical protein